MMTMCDVFNYADDNIVCCSGPNVEDVRKQLEIISDVMIKWFEEHNYDESKTQIHSNILSLVKMLKQAMSMLLM